jgi:hypothetical protein
VGHQNFGPSSITSLMWSVVVALYSCLDRPKDEEPGFVKVVSRIHEGKKCL